MFNFRNKKILITGASSGIGAALAIGLAKKGADLALVARREEKLRDLGIKAKIYVCDVSQQKQVAGVYKRIKKDFGKIDMAFLNAGVGSNNLTQNIDAKEVKKIMEVNFLGVIYWLDPLLKEMQVRNEGIIAITSSLAAYRGLPGGASYNASKAALSAFIESAQIDLLATKIKLVLILPYFMITEMSGLDKKRNLKIWTTAGKAADIIIKSVESGKQEIIFPWHFHLFMYFMKIIPLSWYRLFWKIVRRGG